MAFNKITDDLNVIQALDDEPNDVGGLTAQQLKAKFDEAGNKLKTRFNAFIDQITATSAAANIGFSSTTGVPKTNVQEAIENVQAQIVEVSQDGVADNSITTAKIYDAAVTADKLHSDSVTTEKIYDNAVTNGKIAAGTLLTDVTTAAGLTLSSASKMTFVENNIKVYYCKALGICLLRGVAWFEVTQAGTGEATFTFTNFEPASGENGDAIFGDGNIAGWANNISKLYMFGTFTSEDVGQTMGLNVHGWYFCEGA